jgi:ring-1,2-phenylacetyl-CoA epoxidase subunit PaaC
MNHYISFTLHLADTALILSQRNAAWCGHGPILEQDIALTNITLDLLGQARYLYQHASKHINQHTKRWPPHWYSMQGPVTEDSLAYMRTEREFMNLLLVEQPNGDWAKTILRQYFFSQYQYFLFEHLAEDISSDLSAIAAKALKETKYHLRWSSEWVERLGDGTDESRARMMQAIQDLWPYTGEMYQAADYEKGVYPAARIQQKWTDAVKSVFEEATLAVPEGVFMQTGGKTGIHSEQMGFILAEMQHLHQSHPGADW